MKIKTEHIIGGGLLLGAIVVLWYLHNKQVALPPANSETNPEDLSTQVPAQQSLAQAYPNAGMNPAANIEIGGSPLYLDYNTPAAAPPVISVGSVEPLSPSGCTCESGDANCGTIGNQNWLSQQIKISPDTIQAGYSNLQSLFV